MLIIPIIAHFECIPGSLLTESAHSSSQQIVGCNWWISLHICSHAGKTLKGRSALYVRFFRKHFMYLDYTFMATSKLLQILEIWAMQSHCILFSHQKHMLWIHIETSHQDASNNTFT